MTTFKVTKSNKVFEYQSALTAIINCDGNPVAMYADGMFIKFLN